MRAHGQRYTVWLVVATSMIVRLATAENQANIGLDHIPVAVCDLEVAMDAYQALGFVLKPGRYHANGIRNAHVKFPNGAGIELLTAPGAVDVLSAHYQGLLKAGEGPAFVSFHARDTRDLHAALRKGGYEFQQDGEITKLLAPEFGFLFVVRDNRSPTDRTEHFAHPNGSAELSSVWIATDNGESLARLLVQLGGQRQRRQVLAPDSVESIVITLSEGEVCILPQQHQILPGRPVIGASFRVRDLSEFRCTLEKAGIAPWGSTDSTDRIVVGPSVAHGLWLEFRAGS